jgi:hypothetical protein
MKSLDYENKNNISTIAIDILILNKFNSSGFI